MSFKKLLVTILLTLAVVVALAGIVYAQEPVTTPVSPVEPAPMPPVELTDTAADFIRQFETQSKSWAVFVIGIVSVYLTKFLKRVRWLSPKSKTEVHRVVILVISILVPGVITVAVAEFTPFAVTLDKSGFWNLILAAIGVSQGGFFLESFRQSAKYMARARAKQAGLL